MRQSAGQSRLGDFNDSRSLVVAGWGEKSAIKGQCRGIFLEVVDACLSGWDKLRLRNRNKN